MADHVTELLYGIYFANPADGQAAQAANGGSLDVQTSPEHALVTYPTAVILQLAPYFFHQVPGYFDAGASFSPSQIPTNVDTLTVNDVPPGTTTEFIWSGTIIYTPTGITPDPAAVTGTYDQQVIPYTGDGASDRLIATNFGLDTGVVMVWIAMQGGTPLSCFRHNGGGMAGTTVIGSTTLLTTSGITGMGAAGFTVTPGNVGGINVANGAGTKYVAVVIRDTTSDNRYLKVGNYTGVGAFTQPVVMSPPVGNKAFTGTGFLPDYTGVACTDITNIPHQDYVFIETSPTTGFLAGGPTPFPGPVGGINLSMHGGGRTISVAIGATAPPITHVWIGGRGGQYRSSTDFSGDVSINLAAESLPLTQGIQDIPGNGFIVGTATNVNNSGTHYYWFAIAHDGVTGRVFGSFKVAGTGGEPSASGPLIFRPDIAFARDGIDSSAVGAIWKGPTHLGQDSTKVSTVSGGGDIPTEGVQALNATSVDLGTTVAPGGQIAYGWAFKGLSITFTPVYVPSGPPPLPDPGPPSGNPPPVGTQPNACVAPVFPNV